MCSEPVDARIDATTGLQMSHPVPLPNFATSPENVLIPVTVTISNSSERDCSKCSHRTVDCSTPRDASTFAITGTHDPHEVPARVHFLSSAISRAPLSISEHKAPFVTALHEQICASSGRASTPISSSPPSPFAISVTGFDDGSARPTKGLSTAKGEASPTKTPPRSVVESSERTSLE